LSSNEEIKKKAKAEKDGSKENESEEFW